MSSLINDILSKNPDAERWHQLYPWFAVGHVIHAYKHKNKVGFIAASQKAMIYFGDAQRLHWLLNEQAIDKNDILSKYKLLIQATSQPEIILPDSPIINGESLETIEDVAIIEQEQILPAAMEVSTEKSDDDISEMPVVTEPEQETIVTPEPSEEANIKLTGDPEEAQIQPVEEAETEYFEKTPHSFEEQGIQDSFHTEIEEPLVTAPVAENSITTETPSITKAYDPDDTDGEESDQEEPDLVSVSDIGSDQLESPALHSSLAEVSKSFKSDTTGKDEELKIENEPYHTVDYFASQGIKLVLEPSTDDKFGQQLKSFTSWLKQMKRVPGVKMAEKEVDAEVDAIANSSLEKGEVLTESMAEVLLKQGKTKQAIEVWKKLKEQDPDKAEHLQSLIDQYS